jgi:hypothetical protein
MKRPLWREDGFVIYSYNCFWNLPEQSLWGPSPADSDHILLSHLRLPQPGGQGPNIYIPQEQGGPAIPPGTGFPFHRLLRHAGLRCRYFDPSPGSTSCNIQSVPHKKHITTPNTLRLRYKAQPVNAVRETVAVYCETIRNTDILCRQNWEFS